MNIYAVMIKKLKSRQLKFLLIHIILEINKKLPVLLFTFLIFKDPFSEQGLQTKVKRLLLEKLKQL